MFSRISPQSRRKNICSFCISVKTDIFQTASPVFSTTVLESVKKKLPPEKGKTKNCRSTCLLPCRKAAFFRSNTSVFHKLLNNKQLVFCLFFSRFWHSQCNYYNVSLKFYETTLFSFFSHPPYRKGCQPPGIPLFLSRFPTHIILRFSHHYLSHRVIFFCPS